MDAATFQMIVSITQLLITPLNVFIIGLMMKLYRKIKLIDFKQEALIHALHQEIQNGFSETYKKKLSELIEQDVFINKGKK